MRRPLPFDPIEEAGRQWELRWNEVEAMQAATSIMRVQQIVLSRVDDALRPWDLTFARYEVLVLLHFSREGRLPLGKMGDRLMLHQASVTNLVDRLEHQGYVVREAHPSDRRWRLRLGRRPWPVRRPVSPGRFPMGGTPAPPVRRRPRTRPGGRAGS